VLRQNTVHVTYGLVAGDGGALRLELRPSVGFRSHDGPLEQPNVDDHHLRATSEGYEIHGASRYPPLRLVSHPDRHAFTVEDRLERELVYREEKSRGYDWLGAIWSPGYFQAELRAGTDVTFVASIFAKHMQGTCFGIGVDPADGLLRQGEPGLQLTWMDAKVDDWVVTPRRGKAVEINALFYNACRLLAGWLREERESGEAQEVDRVAIDSRRPSIGVSGTRSAAFSTTSWIRTIRRCGRTSSSPSRCPIRSSTAPGGVASSASWRESSSRRSGYGRSRVVIPTTRLPTRVTFARVTPPIIRAPSGPG
jgi:amylo-alpha-1,6-glucosidase/glycogen debranching enzyme-like protein